MIFALGTLYGRGISYRSVSESVTSRDRAGCWHAGLSYTVLYGYSGRVGLLPSGTFFAAARRSSQRVVNLVVNAQCDKLH